MITTKILADSINPHGVRLTTFLLSYPRFIHAELNTHRAFSRNAASSRARKLAKVISGIRANPGLPERWGTEKPGMSPGEELDTDTIVKIIEIWDDATEHAIEFAERCADLGLHKSLCNRLLEPFDHITTLVTSSGAGLENFFLLRANPQAEPTFQVLAYRMLKDYLSSDPTMLKWGDWHIPDFTPDLVNKGHRVAPVDDQIKIATARCARLSYLTHDGEHDPSKDLELHDKLAMSGHWSPFEHCAQAQDDLEDCCDCSNFDEGGTWSGWLQYRKTFAAECPRLDNDELFGLMANKPHWITL